MADFTDTVLFTIQATRNYETWASYTSSQSYSNEPTDSGGSTVNGSEAGAQYAGSDDSTDASNYGNSTDWGSGQHSEEGGSYDDGFVGQDSSSEGVYSFSESTLGNTGAGTASSSSAETGYVTDSGSGTSQGAGESNSTVSSSGSWSDVWESASGSGGSTQQGSFTYAETAALSEPTYSTDGTTSSNVDSTFSISYSGSGSNGSTGSTSYYTTYDTTTNTSTSASYDTLVGTNYNTTAEQQSLNSTGGLVSYATTTTSSSGYTTTSESTTGGTADTASASGTITSSVEEGSYTNSGTRIGLPLGQWILNGSSESTYADRIVTSTSTTYSFQYPALSTVPTTTWTSSAGAPSYMVTLTVPGTVTSISTYSNIGLTTAASTLTVAAQTGTWISQTGTPFEVYDVSYIVPGSAVAWLLTADSFTDLSLLQDIAFSATGTFAASIASVTFDVPVLGDNSTATTTPTHLQAQLTTSSVSAPYTTSTVTFTDSSNSSVSTGTVPIAGSTFNTQMTTGGLTVDVGTLLVSGSLSNTCATSTFNTTTTLAGQTTVLSSSTFGGLQYHVTTEVATPGSSAGGLINTEYTTGQTTTTAYVPAVGTDGQWSGIGTVTSLTSFFTSFTGGGSALISHSDEDSEVSFYDGITSVGQSTAQIPGMIPVAGTPTFLRPRRPPGVAWPFGNATDRTPYGELEVGGNRFPWPFGIGQQGAVSSPIPGIGSFTRQDALSATVTTTGSDTFFGSYTETTWWFNSRSHSYTANWSSNSITITEAIADSDNPVSSTISYAGVLEQSGANNDSFYVVRENLQLGGWSPDGRDWLAIFPAGAVDSSNLIGGDDGSVAIVTAGTSELEAGSGMTGYNLLPAYVVLPIGGASYTMLPRYQDP